MPFDVWDMDGKKPAVVTRTGLYENEVFTAFDSRLREMWQFESFAGTSGSAGHNDRNIILFAADGRVLLEPFPNGYTPLEWDGDPIRELLRSGRIGNFDGKQIGAADERPPALPKNSQVLMVADLYGDFRDEFVLSVTGDDGGKSIAVVAATHPTDHKYVAATEDRDYRLWIARNMGGGYRSIYDRVLATPGED
ncbi:MAG: rhamnogalacturonan lyase family protein [Planctomycetota bacterium]